MEGLVCYRIYSFALTLFISEYESGKPPENMRQVRNYFRLVGKLLVRVKRYGNETSIREVEEHVKRAKDLMDSMGAKVAGGDQNRKC